MGLTPLPSHGIGQRHFGLPPPRPRVYLLPQDSKGAFSSGAPSGTLMYAMVLKGATMEALKVGMREFRDKLATYLLESESPVAITRHGDTVGYFIPARRRRTDADRTALREASVRWQEVLDAEGISEEEAVAEFKQWRAKQAR